MIVTTTDAGHAAWEDIYHYMPEWRRYIDDPEVTEIIVNPDGSMYVESAGILALVPVMIDPGDLQRCMVRVAARLKDRLDESRPILESRLPDGSRIAVAIPPASPHGISVCIRKFRAQHFTLDELVRVGELTKWQSKFLIGAVASRKNIVISGPTGSGKSTLLNALANAAIPPESRVIVIEDVSEIQLSLPHVVSFEARQPREEYEEITVRTLLRHSLRQRPDRLIVGEMRGAEAFDLLQAWNTGHCGSLTSVHADAAVDSLERFVDLVMHADIKIPHANICRKIAAAAHVLVHVQRRGALRIVTEILEVHGYDRETGEWLTKSIPEAA